jgi:hypothetical protein
MTKKAKTSAKKNMTERTFAESELYQNVLAACEKALAGSGQFNKLDIMKKVKNEALTNDMRWDWIIKKITDGHHMPGGRVELISVAESFFKASDKARAAMLLDEDDPKYTKELSFPGKYCAHGYGKRTAGWVLATYAEGRFALYKVKLSGALTKGRVHATRKFGSTVAKRLVTDGTPGKAAEIATAAGIRQPTLPKS